jgi:holo-[acyl-carrier protein] synthase
MRLATGVDLIDIQRLEAAIQRHGERFLRRIFTPSEIEGCHGRVESLAARFAAKEAVSKALGQGIGDVSWHDIEVTNGELNAPCLTLSGRAQQLAHEKGLSTWSISLSHEKQFAIALVVAMSE